MMEVQLGQEGLCTLKVDEIAVQPEGLFLYTNSIDVGKIDQSVLDFAKAIGAAPEVTKTPSGDMINLQRIDGKFDNDTAVTGTVKVNGCDEPMALSSSAPSP